MTTSSKFEEKTGFVDDYLLYLLAAASEGASAQFSASTLSTATGVTAPIVFSVTEIYNP